MYTLFQLFLCPVKCGLSRFKQIPSTVIDIILARAYYLLWFCTSPVMFLQSVLYLSHVLIIDMSDV